MVSFGSFLLKFLPLFHLEHIKQKSNLSELFLAVKVYSGAGQTDSFFLKHCTWMAKAKK